MRCGILWLWCALLSGHVYADNKASSLPMLSNLARDGVQAQRENKPIILFFTLPGCQFCHVVRNNYLQPLLRDTPRKQRPIIREVDLASTQAVVNLDGSTGNHRSVSRMYSVRAAPTVIFVDAAGCMLVAPIIGGDIAGVYGGYLDNAFDASAQKLAVQKKAGKVAKECVAP